jgi:hypothetical protein
MIRYPLFWVCWFRPHKERRLINILERDYGYNRICKRCGRTRWAKARRK